MTVFFWIVTGYLLLINLLAFTVTALDKYYAMNGRWRIPEKNLLALAFAGGALGELLAMLCARHKIRKLKFTVLVPLFIVLHLLALYTSGYFHLLLFFLKQGAFI